MFNQNMIVQKKPFFFFFVLFLSARLFFIQIASWVKLATRARCQQGLCQEYVAGRGQDGTTLFGSCQHLVICLGG